MLVVKSFTFSPVQENTYVLYNEQKQCCIIDPGCYFEAERDELKTGIEKAGLTPVLLLNTHCHLDHVFGNKFVHETWGLDLHLHEKEKPVLDFAPLSGERWQLPFDNYNGPLVYLKEGNFIKIGEDQLEIRFTPGHSPGSISFYSAKDGFIIGVMYSLTAVLAARTCPVAVWTPWWKVSGRNFLPCRMRPRSIPVMDR